MNQSINSTGTQPANSQLALGGDHLRPAEKKKGVQEATDSDEEPDQVRDEVSATNRGSPNRLSFADR